MIIEPTKDFGKRSGLKVGPVSMGAMRFPKDDDQAVNLIRRAIDAGMIYIDTSRGYGDSEIKLAKALKDGYRQKVILSTKCSPWIKKIDPQDQPSAECTYKRILESMQRLETDYLDFYQIWNIDSPQHYAQATEKGGMIDGIKHAMKEGLVKHTGFTTHDTPENISRYIDEADWCQAILFTHNIMNKKYQQVIAKARQKGIATIVMNPIAGGILAQNCEPIKQAVQNAVGIDDPVEAGHRYLAGDENLDTIICGISKPGDITSTFENYQKPPFTQDQRKAIEKELEKLLPENVGFCTECGYCQPCPKGIKIPQLMHAAYYDKYLGLENRAGQIYNFNSNPDPAECIECGKCEQKCTQKIKIINLLKHLNAKYRKPKT